MLKQVRPAAVPLEIILAVGAFFYFYFFINLQIHESKEVIERLKWNFIQIYSAIHVRSKVIIQC